MKKFAILALALLMAIGPLVSTARAFEPTQAPREMTERNRRHSSRRNDWGRDRGGRRDRGGSFGGAVLGGVISGLIVGGIAAANQPRQPVLVCDTYGNCWYQ